MLELELDDTKKLECLVDLIFEKVLNEPKFAIAYANLSRVLCDKFKFKFNGNVSTLFC